MTFRSKCRRLFPFVLISSHFAFPRFADAQLADPWARFAFKGKLLVIASDTDMLPSAYVDGRLGPAVGPDTLTVVDLGGSTSSPSKLRTAAVPVSNSVTGPPAAVAVTPDGHYAVVAETQGRRNSRDPDATMKDLGPGKKLTVVDLRNPARPVVVQEVATYERPVSVAFNETGTSLVVAYAAPSHSSVPIMLFPFADGKLGHGFEPKVPGYTQSDSLTDAEFVPGHKDAADVIGLTYETPQHPRLAFYTVHGAELAPWGNAVNVDPSPFLVKFTSDGRFALVNSMHNFADGRGTVTSIRLTDSENPSGEPVHAVVSRAETGMLPEGLAVSPNGRWVATANLESSYLPLHDPGQHFFGSVSLLRMDSVTGHLDRVGDFPFDGMLPEPIVFDDSSRFLAVGNFSQFDDPTAGGALEFFRIEENNPQPGRVELVKLRDSLPLPRGPESMAIVR